jgi:hypothetical protein
MVQVLNKDAKCLLCTPTGYLTESSNKSKRKIVGKVFNIFVLEAAAATMKLRGYYLQKELMK